MPDGGSPVLHLVDSAGMYGAERVILTLLAELKDSPFRGVLGCIREDPGVIPDIARLADGMGIETTLFTMRRGLNVRAIWSLGRYIEQNGFRIAHSHGYKTDIFLGLLPDRRRLLATVHGWPIGAMSAKLKMYIFLDTLALRRFDAVVAVSRIMGHALERRIPDRRLHVIYNGIDVTGGTDTRRAELTAALGIPENARVLGFLGRLAPVKGPEYLVDAMPALVAHEHCWLLIAGEGPLRDTLQMRARALGVLDRLRFLGYVNNIDTSPAHARPARHAFPERGPPYGAPRGRVAKASLSSLRPSGAFRRSLRADATGSSHRPAMLVPSRKRCCPRCATRLQCDDRRRP